MRFLQIEIESEEHGASVMPSDNWQGYSRGLPEAPQRTTSWNSASSRPARIGRMFEKIYALLSQI